ncbi:MAG: CPBP family glutamic-type intramembrane protease [Myxococcota bacterium]|nr:CPBP family glutamic-type intramembrane protease [Myxococcota bacterium]
MGQIEREGHGWWPYLVPYLAFLASVETIRRLPGDWAPIGLLLKPGVPGLLILYYYSRGAYPEVRGVALDLGKRALDVGVGVALAGLWMAPFVLVDDLRPAQPDFFDPEQLGAGSVAWVLGLRMFGYALVTPFFEELFIRSFVMRYAEVFQARGDFRDVRLARFTWRSFAATVVVFTLAHAPWEWWVAVPWIVLTNLWFYYRQDIYSVILVHAATNASILVAVTLWSGAVTDASGKAISLWFFV